MSSLFQQMWATARQTGVFGVNGEWRDEGLEKRGEFHYSFIELFFT